MKKSEFTKIATKLRRQGVRVHHALVDELTGSIFGCHCEILLTDLNLADYQRGLFDSHIDKLSSRFQREACQAIVASFRKNRIWTVDGQHRSNLLHRKGYSRTYANVVLNQTYHAEASLFFELNDAPRRMGGWTKFKACLNARNPVCKDLLKMAEKHRLTTPLTPGVRRVKDADIKSANYLLGPYSKGSMKLVESVCKVLDQCWRIDGTRRTLVDPAAKDTALIRGLTNFLREHHFATSGSSKKRVPWKTMRPILRRLGPNGVREIAMSEVTTRIDQRQYHDALCHIFGVDPDQNTPSGHLRLAA